MNNFDKTSSPWLSCDINIWEPIYRGYTPKKYNKKSTVFHQGEIYDSVFIILQGRAKITTFDLNGGEKQLYIAEKGALCCESSSFLGREYFSTAITLVDCLIYEIPIEHVKKVLSENWELNLAFIEFMARKISVFVQEIAELSFDQSLKRVYRVLLNLCGQYGSEKDGKTKINVKFTHQDVAGMVNASRVTVSNIFAMLSEENIICKEDGFFYVTDMGKLNLYLEG